MNELGLLTDRTIGLRRLTEVASDTQQLWLGITDIKARKPAASVLADNCVAGQAVLDLTQTGEVRSTETLLWASPHAVRVAEGLRATRATRHATFCNHDISSRYIVLL